MKNKSKRVVVYLRNNIINPSGYYRVYQYTIQMEGYQFKYRELVPNSVYYAYHFNKNLLNKFIYAACIFVRSCFFLFADSFEKNSTVIINREICPRKCFKIQSFFLKKMCENNTIVWDIDDDILESREISKNEWDILHNESDSILLSTSQLCTYFAPEVRKKSILLNTTDGDFEYSKRILEIRNKLYENTINIVWIATSNNIVHLQSVIKELDESARKIKDIYNKQLVLYCVCNEKVIDKTEYLRINNVIWTRKDALKILKIAHIGIMPLMDNKFARGKGGFKLIQYMAAGLPVVASPVGINNDIVTEDVGKLALLDEWIDAIVYFSSDVHVWERYSFAARKRWEDNYSYDAAFKMWEGILK